MKRLVAVAMTAMIAFGSMNAVALAVEYTKGQVTKIDSKQKKVTIKHGELKNLGMPAMTMVFAVSDDAMIGQVKVGQDIEFVADRVNGKITLTEIKK